MTWCKHDLEPGTCSLCSRKAKSGGGRVLAKKDGWCRACRGDIQLGEEIILRWDSTLSNTRWGHAYCPSYVKTRGEEKRYQGAPAQQPRDTMSRYQITKIAREGEEEEESHE